MPIFELGQAFPVKSHVSKFGSDWLSLSRVIVVTDRKKKKSDTAENNTIGKILFWAVIIDIRSIHGFASLSPLCNNLLFFSFSFVLFPSLRRTLSFASKIDHKVLETYNNKLN